MDKLTTEQKAQRYDETLERVVNIRTGKCETTFIFTEGLFNYLFPELEECNEEEVRKAMIDFFKHEREEGVVVTHYGVNIERMIAWLEKQKTSEKAMQYLKENHSPSEVSDFQTAMNIAVAKAYDKGVKDGLENRGQTFTKKDVDDAWLKGMCDAKHELEKQGEPIGDNAKQELKKIEQRMISAEAKEAMYGKPTAWSEEDEKIYSRICYLIHSAAFENYDVDEVGKELGEYAKITDWLKAIKTRCAWKPSEEQMADLWNMVCECRPSDQQLLQDLYYGLKTLRGE